MIRVELRCAYGHKCDIEILGDENDPSVEAWISLLNSKTGMLGKCGIPINANVGPFPTCGKQLQAWQRMVGADKRKGEGT